MKIYGFISEFSPIMVVITFLLMIFAVLSVHATYNESSSVLLTINTDFEKALSNFTNLVKQNELVRESVSSATAGAVQVLSLLWLRTIVSYQSNYGVSFSTAIRELYSDGGFARFYRGLTLILS